MTREPNALSAENDKCLYELSHLYVWINKLPLTLMCTAKFSEIFSFLCWKVIYGLWAWLPLDRNLLLKNIFLSAIFLSYEIFKILEHCTHSFPFGACFGIGSSCSFSMLGLASLLTKSFMVKVPLAIMKRQKLIKNFHP